MQLNIGDEQSREADMFPNGRRVRLQRERGSRGEEPLSRAPAPRASGTNTLKLRLHPTGAKPPL